MPIALGSVAQSGGLGDRRARWTAALGIANFASPPRMARGRDWPIAGWLRSRLRSPVRNVAIEYRWAESRIDRLPDLEL
jgi:hypothetical protein